jgi:hypothetical protein
MYFYQAYSLLSIINMNALNGGNGGQTGEQLACGTPALPGKEVAGALGAKASLVEM